MKQNNAITANEISEKLNLSLSSVRRKIKTLKTNGQLERIGSDKTGHWKIVQGD
ncbi:MAG: HTH domain-containing protein [Bacteroidetes bacterium]|nr:HTH domain-containing protein [Bacteroidota bacterium]